MTRDEFMYYAKYDRYILVFDSVLTGLGHHSVGYLFDIFADIFKTSSPHSSGEHYLGLDVLVLHEILSKEPLSIKAGESRRGIARVSSRDVVLL